MAGDYDIPDFKNAIKALNDFRLGMYTELGTLNKASANDLVEWMKEALMSQRYFGGSMVTASTKKRKLQAGYQVSLLGFATTVMYHSLTAISTSGGGRESAGFEVGWPHNLQNAQYQARNARSKTGKKWTTSVEEYAAIFDSRFPWFEEAIQEWADNKFPFHVEQIADRMTDRFTR